MLWTIIGILLVLWLLGLIFKIGGAIIHVLLIIAVVVFLFNRITGRKKGLQDGKRGISLFFLLDMPPRQKVYILQRKSNINLYLISNKVYEAINKIRGPSLKGTNLLSIDILSLFYGWAAFLFDFGWYVCEFCEVFVEFTSQFFCFHFIGRFV